MYMALRKTVELLARMVLLVQGKLEGCSDNSREGLVESLQESSKPKNVLIARSLTNISPDGSIVLQAGNVGPQPVKLYRNLKLETFTPRKGTYMYTCMYLVESECESDIQVPMEMPDFDFSGSNLNIIQQQQLKAVLQEFGDLFTPKLGKTSMVKHAIRTKGPQIQQPVRRFPVLTQKVIKQEFSTCRGKEYLVPVVAFGPCQLSLCAKQMDHADFAWTSIELTLLLIKMHSHFRR